MKNIELEKQNRLEKFTYAKDIMGWTADKDGNVFNRKGEKIGCFNKESGYLQSAYWIKGKNYTIRLHQFVYFYFTGEVHEQIDHKSLIGRDVFPFGRNDNRLVNLRPATNSENSQNTNAKGYSWCKKSKKWHAQIYVNGKNINLGLFPTKEEARQAYLNAKAKYHKF